MIIVDISNSIRVLQNTVLLIILSFLNRSLDPPLKHVYFLIESLVNVEQSSPASTFTVTSICERNPEVLRMRAEVAFDLLVSS